MPRKSEISFETKKIIWEMAVKGYRDKYSAIQRHLDRVLPELGLNDDTPDTRIIKRIIDEDINELSPDVVVSELPRHVWELRDDYESIKHLAESGDQAPGEEKLLLNDEGRKEHLSEVRKLLIGWSREIQIQNKTYKGQSKWWSAVEDELFPHMLQHCPSVKAAYDILMSLYSPEKVQDRIRAGLSLFNELGVVFDPLFDPIDKKYEIRSRIYPIMTAVLKDISILSDQQAMEALSKAGVFVDEMVQYRGTIEKTFSSLLDKSESRRNIIEYEMHNLQASLDLAKAVDACLSSNEYTRYKCDWCP